MNVKILCGAMALFAVCVANAAETYKNPILTMDFSDPDVCVGHDDKFYMTASSFGGLPGLPILASDDLVNWRYVAYALKKHPFETHSPEHGNAVWAPSIRRRSFWKNHTEDQMRTWTHEYVIYWGDPDRGVYRVSAPDPRGPWSEPRLVVEGKGIIDPCPLYDDDGRIYLVNGWAQSRAGMNSVLTVRELDNDETKAISDPVMVYDGVPDGNFTTEGPKFYKRNDEYWLFFPAGGVSTGWQVAARGKSPYGPFEAKTVMAQGKSKINGPHQGAWVHCEVEDPFGGKSGSGEDWFVHFSDRDAYGRIVYLQPMKWLEDGWPVIGVDVYGDGCGEPVEEYAMPKGGKLGAQKLYPQLDDEFDGTKPGLQWQWLGKSVNFAGWPTKYGFYRLYSTSYGRRLGSKSSLFGKDSDPDFDFQDNTWNTPNLMVQKFPAFNFTATMKCQCGAKQATEESGLIVQGMDYARIGLRYKGDHSFEVVYTECFGADRIGKLGVPSPEKRTVLGSVPAKVIGAGLRTANVKDVWFKVEVRQTEEIPEKALCGAAMCTFYYSFNGENWTAANGDKPFKASEGKWIGATVGIYALSGPECRDRGWIDADWFRIVRK